ncbi:MAG: hypothetical protein ACFFBS_10075 [Promethearchaeota archaeon]
MRIRFGIVMSVVVLCLLGCATAPTTQQSATAPVTKTQQEVRRTDPALFGFWRIVVGSSTTHFANIDPWDPEILLFRKDAMLDVQVESIKLMRGPYDVSGTGQIQIKLHHWPSSVMFDYSTSNGVLTLKSSKGTQVYKYIGEEK